MRGRNYLRLTQESAVITFFKNYRCSYMTPPYCLDSRSEVRVSGLVEFLVAWMHTADVSKCHHHCTCTVCIEYCFSFKISPSIAQPARKRIHIGQVLFWFQTLTELRVSDTCSLRQVLSWNICSISEPYLSEEVVI